MHYFSYNENKRHGTMDFPVAYYLVDSELMPYAMPLHWHREWELIRVLDGSIDFLVNGEPYEAKSGDVLVIRGGTLHSATAEHCLYECLDFDLHELVLNVLSVRSAFRLFYRNNYLPIVLYTEEQRGVLDIVGEIFESFSTPHSENYRRMSTLGNVNRLFARILEDGYYTERQEGGGSGVERVDMLKPVLEYIEGHFSEEIKLDTLAKIVGMNANYFCRFFSSITGQTPMNYLTHYRIEQASNMLLATGLSVTEIAFRCGFNDAGYFTKIFKRVKGCTPKQFGSREG